MYMFCLRCSLLCLGAILVHSGSARTALDLQIEPPPQKVMSARDVFWSVQDLVPALRYSVLKQIQTGEYEEVAPTTTFHAGDFIRLKVTSNQDGYLYIINRGSSGKWRPLFPAPGTTGTNRLMKRQDVTVPATAWKFEGQPGQEKVFILLTRTPQSNLDKMIASLQSDEGNNAGINDQLLVKVRGEVNEKDLVLTGPGEALAPTGKRDHAGYVANVNTSTPAPRVKVDVVLSYQ